MHPRETRYRICMLAVWLSARELFLTVRAECCSSMCRFETECIETKFAPSCCVSVFARRVQCTPHIVYVCVCCSQTDITVPTWCYASSNPAGTLVPSCLTESTQQPPPTASLWGVSVHSAVRKRLSKLRSRRNTLSDVPGRLLSGGQ